VLTCLLDEETVKGSHHETAARVAELAARLSLANAAAFTFQHVPLSATPAPTASSHSQQVAEALLSSMHAPSGNITGVNVSSASNSVSGAAEYATYFIPSAGSSASVAVPNSAVPADCNSSVLRMSPISPVCTVSVAAVQDTSSEWESKQRRSSVTASSTPASSRQRNGEVDGVSVSVPRRPGRRVDTVAKTLAAVKAGTSLAIRPDAVYQPNNSNNQPAGSAPAVAVNHVKLPDIQTLAHRLPSFQSTVSATVDIKPVISASDTVDSSWQTQSSNVVDRPLSPPSAADVEISTEASLSVSSDTELPVGPVSNTSKKKFQCMFCGIFLSTKCYLKNHINAVHTRSRIYQCDLCAHYFYSAGAARIHKLRNHWHDAKKHKCSECAETFLLPIELRKHMQKKHYGSVGYRMMMDAAKLEPGEILPAQHSTSDTSADGATHPD
jgi:hypothetical protein